MAFMNTTERNHWIGLINVSKESQSPAAVSISHLATGTLFETRATMLLNESFRKIRNG